MDRYVSPIIEIEEVEVDDIIMSIEQGENEGPGMDISGGGGTEEEIPIPGVFSQYFNV